MDGSEGHERHHDLRAAPTAHPSQRPHLAAVVEDAFYDVVGRMLRRLGWRPRLLVYTGYGTPEKVRVMARVLLGPAGAARRDDRRPLRRGFRHFLTVPAPDSPVRVRVGTHEVDSVTDRAGYIDLELSLPEEDPLPPGRQEAVLSSLESAEAPSLPAPLLVLDGTTRFGVVSDIDDTTLVTGVPRPLLATWNTFVRRAGSRRAVPGMAALYRALEEAHPDAGFFYVSNGAWNTAAALRAFLARSGYPAGPLLLTDWGPTLTGWFRSGPQHKRASIDLLMSWFPHVRWLLVGDDGQHDPEIYADAVQRWPDRVCAVAIRQVEHASGSDAAEHEHTGEGPTTADPAGGGEPGTPVVRGRDGAVLAERLGRLPGVLDG
ncbi:App1 family protein [Isoptericola haloaureus]|uniref:Phosphatase domain-containing protein n=1 Tax=Isoptericola haloaureus TaxID=1542902 RepID=A0ABU7Z3L3_9MICO